MLTYHSVKEGKNMGVNTIWKQNRIEQEYNKAYHELDSFFEHLYQNKDNNIININGIDFNDVRYRQGQNQYALDIMEAIKNKEIFLVEAGVGIGKSFGYLLPIFNTYNNVCEFNKIIISTSSIALQEQLLKDIKKISEMLGIEIKVDIAKGINNYACLRKISHHMEDYRTASEIKEKLREMYEQISKTNTSDRNDLIEVSEKVWEHAQLQSRGYCSNCTYSKLCPFYKKTINMKNNNIIITNHANMAKNILDGTDLVKDLDMIVFDEAHKLEENMQNIQSGEIQLYKMIYQIKTVYNILDYEYNKNNDITENIPLEDTEKIFTDIGLLFSAIRKNASINFYNTNKENNSDYSITDANRLGFKITPTISGHLKEIILDLEELFKEANSYEYKIQKALNIKEIEYLKKDYYLFKDMLKNNESTNIYWVEFYKNNRISIFYTPKDNLNITKKIFSKEIPIVCTSGTLLDTESSYKYFSENLGLDKITNRKINYGEAQKSPYDYENNSLFYYNPNISNPNNKNNYIIDLATEISELIKMTNGKSLILFTSKDTMNKVYDILKETEQFPFELLLHTETNTNEIKEKFSTDTNTCLLATGAFWEGIDIKGKSLSNLIITHLPFEQVDAITQYKASKYAKNQQFKEVYFPDMITKLQQAIGRLIRDDEDCGIVCCLDSRFDTYKESIIPNIPMVNYTTDKKELYKFVETKILKEENNQNYIKKLS